MVFFRLSASQLQHPAPESDEAGTLQPEVGKTGWEEFPGVVRMPCIPFYNVIVLFTKAGVNLQCARLSRSFISLTAT